MVLVGGGQKSRQVGGNLPVPAVGAGGGSDEGGNPTVPAVGAGGGSDEGLVC